MSRVPEQERELNDVALDRERQRRRRLLRLAVALMVLNAWLVVRALEGRPALPTLHVDPLVVVPILFFVALIAVMVGTTMGAGRSPHTVVRPEQVDVRLDDVIGIDPIVEDVRRSIDLFWTYRRFADQMGGTPRRGLLFEGEPGTGKTLTAKAMAAEAGVPFLFVSATSFQSMYYGATARKIRSYFRALRRAARAEGGAIGFIEEIDAIGMRRGALLEQMLQFRDIHALTLLLHALAALVECDYTLPDYSITNPAFAPTRVSATMRQTQHQPYAE